MDKSLYLEKNVSQQPAIDLLRSMGYTYISPEDCEVSFPLMTTEQEISHVLL